MSFRGDAHKFYLKLKRMENKDDSLKQTKELSEIARIQSFYKSIETNTLRLIYYRMVKEKNGSGIVPIFVTTVPWFFFLFSKQLQEFLFQEGRSLWIFFSILYILTLFISVIIHFREKAWAAVHIEIIQDIFKTRNEPTSAARQEKGRQY